MRLLQTLTCCVILCFLLGCGGTSKPKPDYRVDMQATITSIDWYHRSFVVKREDGSLRTFAGLCNDERLSELWPQFHGTIHMHYSFNTWILHPVGCWVIDYIKEI